MTDTAPLTVEDNGKTLDLTAEQADALLSRNLISRGEDGLFHPRPDVTLAEVQAARDAV